MAMGSRRLVGLANSNSGLAYSCALETTDQKQQIVEIDVILLQQIWHMAAWSFSIIDKCTVEDSISSSGYKQPSIPAHPCTLRREHLTQSWITPNTVDLHAYAKRRRHSCSARPSDSTRLAVYFVPIFTSSDPSQYSLLCSDGSYES